MMSRGLEHLVSNASPTNAARSALIFAAATVADADALIERIAAARNPATREGVEMSVSPTVLDVARAVAKLDELVTPGRRRTVATYANDRDDAIARVARNLAYQFAKHNGWGGRRNVTTRDVRAALIAHGASTLTVEQHARAIASRIRSDFTDGKTS